jgi:hypothetical protein
MALVAKAFNHNVETLSDEEAPSETFVYLLIPSFMLTLIHFQCVTFWTILSLLIPNAIEIGKSGTSPIFSSCSTCLPTSHADMKHFYTDHATSILRNIPAHITHNPQSKGKWNYLFIYDCTQHCLACWGPPLVDFFEDIAVHIYVPVVAVCIGGDRCYWQVALLITMDIYNFEVKSLSK